MINLNIFVDTNILVYFKTLKSPFFDIANTKLIKLYIDNEIFISKQVLKEYLVAMTRLSSETELTYFVDDANYFSDKFNVLYENKESQRLLFDLISRFKVITEFDSANFLWLFRSPGFE